MSRSIKKAKAKQKDITQTTNIPNRFPRKVTSGVTKKAGRATVKRSVKPMK